MSIDRMLAKLLGNEPLEAEERLQIAAVLHDIGRPPETDETLVMAMEGPQPDPTDPDNPAHEDVNNRFREYAVGKSQGDAMVRIRVQCRRLGHLLVDLVPDHRERARALSALEDVMFNANAGIARRASYDDIDG